MMYSRARYTQTYRSASPARSRGGLRKLRVLLDDRVGERLGGGAELLDLRVRRHRPFDLLPHLALRDPSGTGSMPCVVRADNASRRAFQLCVYCEGSLMERAARCLADASAGKELRRFTIYSACARGKRRRTCDPATLRAWQSALHASPRTHVARTCMLCAAHLESRFPRLSAAGQYSHHRFDACARR